MKRATVTGAVLTTILLMGIASAGERPSLGAYTVHEVRAFVMEKPRRFARKITEVRYGGTVELLERDPATGWCLVRVGAEQGWVPGQVLTAGKALSAGTARGGTVATTDQRHVQLAAQGFSPQVEASYRATNPDLQYELVDAMEATVPEPDAIVRFAHEGTIDLGEAP